MQIKYRNLELNEAQKFWNMMNLLDNETKFMLYEPGERQEKTKNLVGIETMIKSSLDGTDFLLVAEQDDEIAGYISAQRGRLKRVLHTAYIVVGIREKFRGMGIGTEFFNQLDCWAKDRGIIRLELTVVCTNHVARKLYEKNGFTIEGIKKNSMMIDGIYTDEYYMAKIL